MNKVPQHLTLIEDDEFLSAAISGYLRNHGYIVSEFSNGQSGFEFLLQSDTDLLICDIELPDISGLELVNQLKVQRDIGVIFISSYTSVTDRIDGLSRGADDYICKPIDANELLWRVKAVLARIKNDSQATTASKEDSSLITFLDLSLNVETRVLRSSEQQIKLGSSEFELLNLLLSKQGKICSREHIIHNMVRGIKYQQGRALDRLVARLRKKINEISPSEAIVTYRGKGYMVPLNQ